MASAGWHGDIRHEMTARSVDRVVRLDALASPRSRLGVTLCSPVVRRG